MSEEPTDSMSEDEAKAMLQFQSMTHLVKSLGACLMAGGFASLTTKLYLADAPSQPVITTAVFMIIGGVITLFVGPELLFSLIRGESNG
jgi:hypothetical protein